MSRIAALSLVLLISAAPLALADPGRGERHWDRGEGREGDDGFRGRGHNQAPQPAAPVGSEEAGRGMRGWEGRPRGGEGPRTATVESPRVFEGSRPDADSGRGARSWGDRPRPDVPPAQDAERWRGRGVDSAGPPPPRDTGDRRYGGLEGGPRSGDADRWRSHGGREGDQNGDRRWSDRGRDDWRRDDHRDDAHHDDDRWRNDGRWGGDRNYAGAGYRHYDGRRPGDGHGLRDRDYGRRWYEPSYYYQHYRAPVRYRAPVYVFPRGYYARTWYFGEYLPYGWYTTRYYLDWRYYDLPYPPIGCEWIRVGGDALLVDVWTGQILSVYYDLFW